MKKNILSFANSWRRTDAYIFIGAEEVKGGRSKILGVQQHIDDAKLQQFVNSKTNRPVEFSYRAFEMEGHQVALIHIPVQQRPTYLEKDYGTLRRHVVYLRRGSSTDVASPQEVARMGAVASFEAAPAPQLSPFLVAGEYGEIAAQSLNLTLTKVQIPDEQEFPLYGRGDYGGFRLTRPLTNSKFYSRYAQWWQSKEGFGCLRICVENTGLGVATDVKVIADVNDDAAGVVIGTQDDLPGEPSPTLDLVASHMRTVFEKPDVTCHRTATGWRVTAFLGKIQAQDRIVSKDLLCITADDSVEVAMNVQIFADELRTPVQAQFSVNLDVKHESLSVEDFLAKVRGVADE
jgi:hypothetical protein